MRAWGKDQERLEDTLNLHRRLIRDTKTLYNNHNNKQTKKAKISKLWERGEKNLISRVTVLLDSSNQCLTKNHKAYKETARYGPFKGEKKNQHKLSLRKT